MKIYLIRHGSTVTSDPKKYIGITNISLSQKGRTEAAGLGKWFKENTGINFVYSSPLDRCTDTAGIICDRVKVLDELKEINLGEWDGEDICSIQKRDPAAYLERGRKIGTYRINGGESFLDVSERALSVLKTLIDTGESEAALITHAGWIRALLCRLTDMDINNVFAYHIPYASITELETQGQRIIVRRTGYRPLCLLDENEIEYLYQKYGVSENVKAHMRKVAEVCGDLLKKLPADYDYERIYKAALLHDLLRAEKNHAYASAEAVRKEGYHDLVPLIREHHSMIVNVDDILTEEEILYYADKLVQGDQVVTLEQRFSKSLEKCTTAEAAANHKKRYDKALLIEKKIEERIK